MERALVDEFIELVSIDAESGDEAEIAAHVMSKLREIGLDVEMDDAGTKFGGNTGNVIGRAGEGDPIILCAHLDRVKPGKGIKPVVDDGIIRSSGDTVLAADDISGVVAILAGLREAKKHKPLPAVEVVFTVSEETRLQGSRHLDYNRLRSKMAYIFDASSPVGTVITSSPTHVGFEAHVAGQAAHAAVNPQDGVSAIRAAVFAISKLPFGWVDDHTTTNVGVLHSETNLHIHPPIGRKKICLLNGHNLLIDRSSTNRHGIPLPHRHEIYMQYSGRETLWGKLISHLQLT
jgi:tripeptide aminopeptidase